jgi:hypothetical protein
MERERKIRIMYFLLGYWKDDKRFLNNELDYSSLKRMSFEAS